MASALTYLLTCIYLKECKRLLQFSFLFIRTSPFYSRSRTCVSFAERGSVKSDSVIWKRSALKKNVALSDGS